MFRHHTTGICFTGIERLIKTRIPHQIIIPDRVGCVYGGKSKNCGVGKRDFAMLLHAMIKKASSLFIYVATYVVIYVVIYVDILL